MHCGGGQVAPPQTVAVGGTSVLFSNNLASQSDGKNTETNIVVDKPGDKYCRGKWAKINKVMEIENILKKSWTSYGNTCRESRTRSSDNSIFLFYAVIWLSWEAFGLCSRFQIVMLGRR